jgi:hypothetical protein
MHFKRFSDEHRAKLKAAQQARRQRELDAMTPEQRAQRDVSAARKRVERKQATDEDRALLQRVAHDNRSNAAKARYAREHASMTPEQREAKRVARIQATKARNAARRGSGTTTTKRKAQWLAALRASAQRRLRKPVVPADGVARGLSPDGQWTLYERSLQSARYWNIKLVAIAPRAGKANFHLAYDRKEKRWVHSRCARVLHDGFAEMEAWLLTLCGV